MHMKTLQCDKVYHRDLGGVMEGTKFGWQCLEMIEDRVSGHVLCP